MRTSPGQRRVLVKARVVRHIGTRFTAAPLARHIAYLKREGVTRDGRDAGLFGSDEGEVDGGAFAERCAGDRHHFRFIVSPEDAGELSDIRAFTRELLTDMAKDLGTRLDWVAVDHWNTDNPHIHVLVRGKADDGRDLVIDKDYIREGMRSRAEGRATIELGPRSEREIDRALAREVAADRWTSLDGRLRRMADDLGGVIDLRPDPHRPQSAMDRHLIGRIGKLERLGLATNINSGCWTLAPGAEQTLRQIGVRGDIIKTMHQAMTGFGGDPDPGRFSLHEGASGDPIVGRLIERGLHDELTGQAYAVVDGIDGFLHHLRFADIDSAGDMAPGGIVELSSWTDRRGRERLGLRTQSDLDLAGQITARGLTWLDRQLIANEPPASGIGFGAEVEAAKFSRLDYLESEGLARRTGDRFVLGRDVLATLRKRELDEAASAISREHGLPYRERQAGGAISGIYRQRIQLASGRLAMIEDGLGFALVPWSKQLDHHLGQYVRGSPGSGGGIEWSPGRSRSIGI